MTIEPEEVDFSDTTYKFLRSFISQALQGKNASDCQMFILQHIANIVHSGHLRPRYDKKPCWWPGDICFISPNHPPGDYNNYYMQCTQFILITCV